MAVADAAVLSLCQDVWQWRLSESPELATYYGFHQYDDKWDDISEEVYIRRQACVKEFLQKAELLKTDTCSPDVALSHALLTEDLRLYLEGTPYKTYLLSMNFMEGIHTVSSLIISYMRFDTVEDFNKYIARLEGLPHRINQVMSVLRRGVEDGIVHSSSSVSPIPGQIDNIVNSDDVSLLMPFRDPHPQISPEQIEKFHTQAKDVVFKQVFPTLLALKNYLQEDYFNHLRPEVGISSLKNGSQWYRQALRFFLTCDMSPQEVHERGLQEVIRIKNEILKVAQKEGMSQDLREIAQEVTSRMENHFQSKEHVLDYVKNICFNMIRPKLSMLFKNLPDAMMKVEMAPAYLKDVAAGMYLSGTPDGKREGCYIISANNFSKCLRHQLLALSLHEGEPGHHLQGIYALAATHLPDFRRYNGGTKYYLAPARFGLNTAYCEGWGLYAEALGEELGLYQDNMDLLGRYTFEIMRAARMVVDTGVNAFGWSKERAVQYMLDNTLSREAAARAEVDRYVTMPGQACAYKVGEIKIWELRRKAEKQLGDQFDIKEFHHRVLSCGAVPLRILEMLVDQYIQDSRADVGSQH